MKPKLSFSTVKRLYIDIDPIELVEPKKNLIRRFLNSPNALAYYIKDLIHDINLDLNDELIKQDDDRNSVIELVVYLNWLKSEEK